MSPATSRKSILTMLDFDDCLFPNTIQYYQPVLRDMLKAEIRRLKPDLTDEDYLAGEANSLATSGSYFHHWQQTLAADDAGWTNKVYMPMLPEQVKAIKANLKPDAAVANAIADLTARGHTIYIVTHGHIDYCWPLTEFAGLSDHIPKHRIIDIARAGFQYKSSGAPYRMVQTLENRQFDVMNMADDVVANLRPLRAMGILGHLVSEIPPLPQHHADFDFHHETILSALQQMATQTD